MVILFILLGFLPSFAWLFFFLKEDIHPEPKKMLARAFIYGVIATAFAIALQFLLKYSLDYLSIGSFSLISFFLLALTEEIFKFLAAYLAVRKSSYFDEPVDAMIYMITASLGFALVENIGVAFGTGILKEVLGIMVIRFVGATLLHALSSGIVGYYWAKAHFLFKLQSQNISPNISGPESKEIKSRYSPELITQGILLASLLHAIFNYLIILVRAIAIYPLIFLIIISLFVFWDFEKLKSTNN